ncbi:hypothetical protein CHS0354_030929 [Potamilus streckersoni]|uniref:tRNA-intron lyase n=1 Tax=Potamilus streckersoni TaxID=2493646 RepID=A0AAE0RUQ9_9BIVA|nr:hypothetical protein CHS0354_030929 [Potamilus streckersoni]
MRVYQFSVLKMVESKVKLHLCNGQCFIWNANDADVLRQEFHCVGSLVGCLPRAPRQNTHLGLPLQLLPEETTLLLEKGVAELVSTADTLFDPNEKLIEEFKAHRKSSYCQQIELFRAERKKEILQNLPKIIEGKRAKRQKMLEEKHEAGETVDKEVNEDEEEFNVDKITIPPVPEHHALVQLYTESPYIVTGQSSPPLWSYPSTDQERLRYSVFKDLWEKGYFITSGSKFGGDFLVYPEFVFSIRAFVLMGLFLVTSAAILKIIHLFVRKENQNISVFAGVIAIGAGL